MSTILDVENINPGLDDLDEITQIELPEFDVTFQEKVNYISPLISSLEQCFGISGAARVMYNTSKGLHPDCEIFPRIYAPQTYFVSMPQALCDTIDESNNLIDTFNVPDSSLELKYITKTCLDQYTYYYGFGAHRSDKYKRIHPFGGFDPLLSEVLENFPLIPGLLKKANELGDHSTLMHDYSLSEWRQLSSLWRYMFQLEAVTPREVPQMPAYLGSNQTINNYETLVGIAQQVSMQHMLKENDKVDVITSQVETYHDEIDRIHHSLRGSRVVNNDAVARTLSYAYLVIGEKFLGTDMPALTHLKTQYQLPQDAYNEMVSRRKTLPWLMYNKRDKKPSFFEMPVGDLIRLYHSVWEESR
jgi:hypothetical protein